MYKKGTIQITGDLKLKNFTWNIEAINWSPNTGVVKIEVLMYEKSFKHSREFTYSTDKKQITEKECLDYLLTLSQFKGSA